VWEYDANRLRQAVDRAERYAAASRADAVAGGSPLDALPYTDRFAAALDDDLDTPAALLILDELADALLAATGQRDLVAAQGVLRQLAGVLGLQLRG
jgi:cysteinyl-tRNA synthetase